RSLDYLLPRMLRQAAFPIRATVTATKGPFPEGPAALVTRLHLQVDVTPLLVSKLVAAALVAPVKFRIFESRVSRACELSWLAAYPPLTPLNVKAARHPTSRPPPMNRGVPQSGKRHSDRKCIASAVPHPQRRFAFLPNGLVRNDPLSQVLKAQ